MTELPLQLAQVFYTIVLPILLIVGIGWLIQRRLGLDMTTLRRLNFYFVMPALIYFSVTTSKLTASRVRTVMVFALVCLCVQAILTLAASRLARVPRDLRRATLMTTMFYNSGNYGLPLQGLAFGPQGLGPAAMAYQTFVMITQNLANFTVGILIVSGGRKDQPWKQNLLHIAKFPPLYALAAALITLQVRAWLGESAGPVGRAIAPFWAVVVWIKNAFIAVALMTLGAQLALVRREAGRYAVRLNVLLRLLGGPAIALGMIYLLGIDDPLVAQVLLISASTPTAVNVMLLCLEFDNHPDLAARAVFYSTLLSPVTVTLTIFVAQANVLPGFVR